MNSGLLPSCKFAPVVSAVTLPLLLGALLGAKDSCKLVADQEDATLLRRWPRWCRCALVLEVIDVEHRLDVVLIAFAM